MTRTRSQIAQSAADKLASAPSFAALVGFDGFIDEIIAVVDQRHDMSPTGYTRLKTIPQFAARAAAAAGKSTNMELVVTEERWGGNGPLMAGALGELGAQVTFIGAVGQDADPRELHPLYSELGARCVNVIPIAPPAHTDALEFEDGKIMLGRTANVQRVTWEEIVRVVGVQTLRDIVSRVQLIGINNWTMLGGVNGIWEGLCRDVFAALPKVSTRVRVFIDLSDPAKRTVTDIAAALDSLAKMNMFVPVTLGLNLAEAEQIASVLKLKVFTPAAPPDPQMLQSAAAAIRAAARLDTVVIHPRHGAAAATPSQTAWFDGPFTSHPRLSTGAGDHFNGGFSFAQTLDLDLEECVAVGCAVSGVYVRDARSPGKARLIEFLRELPATQVS